MACTESQRPTNVSVHKKRPLWLIYEEQHLAKRGALYLFFARFKINFVPWVVIDHNTFNYFGLLTTLLQLLPCSEANGPPF